MNHTEPSWDLYRTFLSVLREGSLSGAARALGLTQPTVGRHIEALEQAIGLQLFTRSQRGLIATEAALELRPHAEALASTAASLLRAASGQGGAVKGSVRVSASQVVGVEVLPPILSALRERYPELVIELVVSNAVEDLLRRDADIAVRMVEPSQEALVVKRLGTISLGLHAHRRYLERHGTPKRIEDLATHSVIGFDRETEAIRGMMKRVPKFDTSRFALRTDNDLAQLAAIRAGFGIGICQVAVARRDRDLVRVLPATFELKLGTWLAMHEDLRSIPRCRAVFDALAAGLKGHVER
ncbi:LysR family transcriptional regulator [Vitiosangium sp. GDMCC 1.1324]|uniref:LysR family transcriptional regulator n=1 Tax=Vitiosangium sp. (strain GDMCC 1.1324) TaxID=2138576 RepID=UPI000D3B10D6|nr:LysR family transcriptional regulator [Vitiosangium sp. GDMCC 1.1324]PTL75467.1 LysR family transcriptional regulator [Vitiosangium sp. GDMCC 1.1324]